MATIHFTQNLRRHLVCPPADVPGNTVREVLDRVFDANPLLKSYLLDDQNNLRKHIVIFAGGQLVKNREKLDDPVQDSTEIHVMQALSGG